VLLRGDAERETTSDANGYYRFDELEEGAFIVVPILPGFFFTPPSVNVELSGADAFDVNFIATPSSSDVGVAVNSIEVFRSLTLTKQYCNFTVSLNKALNPGESASVYYDTVDGTAIAGEDYIAQTNKKLTFLYGESLTQIVKVELKMGTPADPQEFFSLVLSKPSVNIYLAVSSGTCTIITPQIIFLPTIRK